jgi:hypothetical protein
MPRFRKKPVVIEAVQWTGRNGADVNAFLSYPASDWRADGADILIETLEGTMAARPGDYIIRGVQGEVYPCKPDIFEATYEAA